MVSEIVGKIEWAKKQMRAALWGLALLVAAWLILYTINPDLITFKLNVQQISTNTPTPAAQSTGTQCGGQAVCVSGAGTVPTIQTADGNAAINNYQNTPNTVRDASVLADASKSLRELQAHCLSNTGGGLGGTLGTIGSAQNACTGDGSPHILGSQVFTNCANIPTPSGSTQACYYNQ